MSFYQKVRKQVIRLGRTFKEAFLNWMDDSPFRWSAIVAYYAILSLPALMILILNTVGFFWKRSNIEEEVISEISGIMGDDTAKSIETMIDQVSYSQDNTLLTILGIATLIYGATGVFYHVQISFDKIWEVEESGNVVREVLIHRAKSFAFILIIGFLLLISFILTTLITTLSEYIQRFLGDFWYSLMYYFDLLFSFFMITLLFAAMFKFLPSRRIPWRSVWAGGICTAFLFLIGKFLLGLYFGKAEPGSTYGAAGSIVVIMLWVSYSSLIIFYGAHFTRVTNIKGNENREDS
ncbi:YihY/virulence factor BrkB family protein [Robertkochia aurantiaca]|uniref:YihY/virulence factor BrkB family protein n=1 Tax=Robertkochia aurantiaca TaxID=2873700 RepID=UPI001CCA69CE|nr:YihY/virulence factor BrkB family protein [Robertkochia sp. 3YJGBD-33]